MEGIVADLTARVNALGNSSAIPFNVQKAFENRLHLPAFPIFKVDTDYDTAQVFKSVNEGGSATYSVANTADEVLTIFVEGLGEMNILAYNP